MCGRSGWIEIAVRWLSVALYKWFDWNVIRRGKVENEAENYCFVMLMMLWPGPFEVPFVQSNGDVDVEIENIMFFHALCPSVRFGWWCDFDFDPDGKVHWTEGQSNVARKHLYIRIREKAGGNWNIIAMRLDSWIVIRNGWGHALCGRLEPLLSNPLMKNSSFRLNNKFLMSINDQSEPSS